HNAHGGDRGSGAFRRRSDDGSRHGRASSWGHTTDCGSEHHGRFTARSGHRGRSAGNRYHDGGIGRTARRNWTQSGGGAGGHIPGDSAVLRTGEPLAANLAKTADDEHAYYHVLRVLLLAFLKGISPIMAVEIARRAIPGHVRPSFQEVEQTCRGGGAAAAAAPAE